MISGTNNYRLSSQLTRQKVAFSGKPQIAGKINQFFKDQEIHIVTNIIWQLNPVMFHRASLSNAIISKLSNDIIEVVLNSVVKGTTSPPPLKYCCTNIFSLGVAGEEKLEKGIKKVLGKIHKNQ